MVTRERLWVPSTMMAVGEVAEAAAVCLWRRCAPLAGTKQDTPVQQGVARALGSLPASYQSG